jgi:hypothetical protein
MGLQVFLFNGVRKGCFIRLDRKIWIYYKYLLQCDFFKRSSKMKKNEIEGFLSHLATIHTLRAMVFKSDSEKIVRPQGRPSLLGR